MNKPLQFYEDINLDVHELIQNQAKGAQPKSKKPYGEQIIQSISLQCLGCFSGPQGNEHLDLIFSQVAVLTVSVSQ